METAEILPVNNVIQLDVDRVLSSCRVCLSRGAEMSCIFDEEHCNVIHRIEFCTGLLLKEEEGLPSNICKMCLSDLTAAYKFKTSCLLTNNTLRKFMQSFIKYEVTDEEVKQTYHEQTVKDGEQYSGDGDYDDAINVKDELFEVFEENFSEIKKERNGSTIELDTEPKRKKRGPYKKTKLMKSKKLQPVKKLTVTTLFCQSCNIKFENKQQAITHKKDCHKDAECWVCEVCGKMFVHRASHNSHVKSHAPPRFACAQCDYKTWYKNDLVKHVRRHDGIKLYQCEYCTAAYYASSNLTNHIRRVHEGQKRFQCSLCDKRFYDRTKLNRHLDSHNDIKRFKCDVCNACFSRRCYWKKHLLRQHNVVTPPQRPGRQKINFVAGQDLIDRATTFLHQ